MQWTHYRNAVAAGAILVLPVAAQDPPVVVTTPPVVAGSPPAGLVLTPDGVPYNPPVGAGAPVIEPCRPGLFGWRRKYAEHKRHLQEAALGYPEEFCELPLGKSVYANGRTEVANAVAARLVLNQFDFVGQTAELNYRGVDKLRAIVAGLPSSFAPVIVERTPWNPRLAEARRAMLLEKLAQGTFPVPPERVVIGPPIPQGLNGSEAVLVEAGRAALYYTGAGGGGGINTGGGLDGSGLGPIGAAPGGSGVIGR